MLNRRVSDFRAAWRSSSRWKNVAAYWRLWPALWQASLVERLPWVNVASGAFFTVCAFAFYIPFVAAMAVVVVTRVVVLRPALKAAAKFDRGGRW